MTSISRYWNKTMLRSKTIVESGSLFFQAYIQISDGMIIRMCKMPAIVFEKHFEDEVSYIIIQWLCTRFVICRDSFWFVISKYHFNTDTDVIIPMPQSQWRNPVQYGWIHKTKPLTTNEIITRKQSTTQPGACCTTSRFSAYEHVSRTAAMFTRFCSIKRTCWHF